ncbi:ADP-ribosylglycohydrolase [Lachnospiraceae bacterium NE2001]|nr:ADP-ribosylglycohydrolase [Lachnospiraceae bacterium NE2001]
MGKVEDALLGLAVGDALGVPVEFRSREELMEDPVTDMRGYGSHRVPAGTWSDDTSMTIATMDAILNSVNQDNRDNKNNDNQDNRDNKNSDILDYYEIMNRFVKWFNDSEYTATGFVFDIGMTCCDSIMNYFRCNIEPTKSGQVSIGSNGNGSLMRIMPIAFYADSKRLNDDDICRVTSDVSSLTHGHSISRMGCYIYVQFLIRLIHGLPKDAAYNEVKKLRYSDYFDADTIQTYGRVLLEDIGSLPIDEIKSSGYVVDSLEAALWCILNNDSFQDTVLQAVNLGKDTDTVGAIAGAAAGIIYGKDKIPAEWLQTLARNEYLSELANNFEQKLSAVTSP